MKYLLLLIITTAITSIVIYSASELMDPGFWRGLIRGAAVGLGCGISYRLGADRAADTIAKSFHR